MRATPFPHVGRKGGAADVSRKVEYHITVDVSINESDLALLKHLGALFTEPGSPTRLSAKRFAADLGMSLTTVRRSLRTLACKGLIVTRSGTRDDGGRDVNGYEITTLGLKVLESQGFMRPRRIPEKR